jgi:hypothetical protein
MAAIKRWAGVICLGVMAGAAWRGLHTHSPRSPRSFDEILRLVAGKTETEVEHLLGRPDTRESRLADDDVWVWWDYTFLDGEHYAPELRGQVVHLEITFDRPEELAGQTVPHVAWRVAGPFSVNFSRRRSKS